MAKELQPDVPDFDDFLEANREMRDARMEMEAASSVESPMAVIKEKDLAFKRAKRRLKEVFDAYVLELVRTSQISK